MQRLKPEMRDALLNAAAREFAERGFDDATLPGIARRAGTAPANVYRYFKNKQALYRAVMPPRLVERMKTLMKRRIASYGTPEHASLTEALMRVSLEHRDRIVLLLTSYGDVREKLVEHLSASAVVVARRERPGYRLSRSHRYALEQIYDNFLNANARVYLTFENEAEVRAAIDQLTRYHVAGLQAFFEGESA